MNRMLLCSFSISKYQRPRGL